jgi:hypothetical protein
MKRILIGLGAVAMAATISLGATAASASPLVSGHGVAMQDSAFAQAQYIERRERVIQRGPVYRGEFEQSGPVVRRREFERRGPAYRGGPRYIERRVVRPRREVCRVEVVRRMTPRGMVVERIRRCR